MDAHHHDGPRLLLVGLPHPSYCSTRAWAVYADYRHDPPTDGRPGGERDSKCMKLNSNAQIRGRRQLGSGQRMMEGDIVVSQRELPGSAGFLSAKKPKKRVYYRPKTPKKGLLSAKNQKKIVYYRPKTNKKKVYYRQVLFIFF